MEDRCFLTHKFYELNYQCNEESASCGAVVRSSGVMHDNVGPLFWGVCTHTLISVIGEVDGAFGCITLLLAFFHLSKALMLRILVKIFISLLAECCFTSNRTEVNISSNKEESYYLTSVILTVSCFERDIAALQPDAARWRWHSGTFFRSLASFLKLREADQSGDGIKSLMNRVESFLGEGKLSEAADTLENGVKALKQQKLLVIG
ncbi:hypothetical protein Acr_00g0020840 [Actinidia rufa]|uniref:Uncharacterized protein n=1 Tax=Actinidia rufa TaxID=165716 RepID=A0A7J0DC53_9ERIC|nr:hypothetical protein Acr_00g0020840 [Actinidia rufa]